MTNPKLNKIDGYKTVGKFLQKFPKYKTRHGYKSAIKRYFDFLDVNPDEYIKDVRLMENGERIKTLDGYEDDITAFWSKMIQDNTPPKTLNYHIAVVRVFLKNYKIDISDSFWKDLRRRGNGNSHVTKDEPITREILQQILTHGDTKSRALFLMLSSSGMRVGEALKLLPTDIDFNSNPTKITIRVEISKNKKERICFISDEATTYLKEWLKIRDDYLKTASSRTKINTYHGLIEKQSNDPRVFPFSTDTARDIWDRLIKNAGYDSRDERTGRNKYHIHGLRKYFRTQFSRSESPRGRDISEVLMGHSGYLNSSYLRIPEQELKEEYQTGEKHLTVFEIPESESEIEAEVERRLKERMSEMKEELFEKVKEYLNTPETITMDYNEIKH